MTPGRVPRMARLMALALRFDQLHRAGQIKDYTELARLGHVTRTRVCQVMNLLQLAPDIQEAILFLPLTERGHDRIQLRQLFHRRRVGLAEAAPDVAGDAKECHMGDIAMHRNAKKCKRAESDALECQKVKWS